MDELSKSFPAAEGLVEAEQSARSQRHNKNCLNCGTPLMDAFCYHCGQKDVPRRQTMGELLINFISSFSNYEGKFFQTTKYLITRPGFLAVEYNAGRRESYFHPARMYVFISFVFFLLFFSLPDSNQDAASQQEAQNDIAEEGELKKVIPPAVLDSMVQKNGQEGKTSRFRLEKSDYKSIQAYDSAQLAKDESDRDGWIKRKFVIRSIELNKRYEGNMGKFGSDFGATFKENFSKLLFYLLPVFALLFKLLYVRKDYFYSEHLVFSIYYYNFFYLAGCLMMLANLIPGMDWLGTIIGFWILFYLLFAMKRMYQQSWGKTILKFALFNISFFIFASIGFAISAMVVLMMI